jgi:hypothetical protein
MLLLYNERVSNRNEQRFLHMDCLPAKNVAVVSDPAITSVCA